MNNIFRPVPEAGIGNLSLQITTHALSCKNPMFHKDCLSYGRHEMIKIPNIVDVDVPVGNGNGRIMSIHAHMKNPGHIMKQLIQPTDMMNELIEKNYHKLKDCAAGFHIRRGTFADDSSKYAYYPCATMTAVDAMIDEANKINKPVYVSSDSISTKKYFTSKVPKAVCLDIEIGFTADEHSQKKTVPDENIQSKINSMLEWFLLSRMPRVYISIGGTNGHNMDGGQEGVTSTFGYSAAIYGDKIPWYVFNDGIIFYADPKRFNWSLLP